ncbi:MAG: dodecin domain-containing protein [Alphaproteobacteria bacterium]|nr:dodecin domain-containing protein [Alphaproteobacteria bacterium]
MVRHRHSRSKRGAENGAASELVGTSKELVGNAIGTAIATAHGTLRNLDWFEVVNIRGGIANGEVADFLVTIKIGFRYEK